MGTPDLDIEKSLLSIQACLSRAQSLTEGGRGALMAEFGPEIERFRGEMEIMMKALESGPDLSMVINLPEVAMRAGCGENYAWKEILSILYRIQAKITGDDQVPLALGMLVGKNIAYFLEICNGLDPETEEGAEKAINNPHDLVVNFDEKAYYAVMMLVDYVRRRGVSIPF